MATQENRPIAKTEFVRRLTEAGLRDFIVIEKETAESVLTERRLEILEALRDEAFETVTGLAAHLGRDTGAVSRDLTLLFEHDLIEYDRRGSRKAPVLKHGTVLVEPIL